MKNNKTGIVTGRACLTGVIGVALTVPHRAKYGKHWDEKMGCHGKIGAGMIASSLIGILGMDLLEGGDI